MAKFGRSGVRELAEIHARILKAVEEQEAHPEDPLTAHELEIAELESELFLVEHDNAGAFKTKKLGRRIQELFEPGADGKPDLAFDENGDLRMAESQAERRFLMVNMGELDRFNKEGGGHAAGDAALTATAEAIQRIVNEALDGKEGAESEYDVYRFDGNTFAVDLAKMSLPEFGKLIARMQEARPSVKGVKDPAPLTVRGLDFRDAVDLVNHTQAELPPTAKLDAADEAAREIFSMLRRSADWDLEASKFGKRAERMKEKIAEGEAEAFFENYAKKAFQGTELETLEGFKRVVESGAFQETVDRLAIWRAEKRFADGRRVDDQVQEMIDARVRERGIPPKAEEGSYEPYAPAKPVSHGKRLLAEKSEAAAKAKAAAEKAKGSEVKRLGLLARKAQLESQIETARRDGGTGLLDRGMHYEELEQALEEDRDVAAVFVDMGFLKYFDQMGGSDVGDDALNAAARMMEQAVADVGVEGRVYRYGGDEFTIQVEGGAAAANKVIQRLEVLREESQPIQRTAKSLSEYAPEQLSFNYGLADRAMLDELYRAAKDGGVVPEGEQVDAKRDRNLKADLMTKAADVGIEYNKAYSRFMLLIKKLRDPDIVADPARKAQLDSLIGFSNKALFAELGGADHLRVLAADLSLEGEALDEAVLDYVVKKVDETRAREKGQKALLDVLLAAQTKVALFKSRVEALQEANEKLASVNAQQKASLDRALAQKTAAEREKLKIIETRGAIDRAA